MCTYGDDQNKYELKWKSLYRQDQLNWFCENEANRYLIISHEHKVECSTPIPLEGLICTIQRTRIMRNKIPVLIDHIGCQKPWTITMTRTYCQELPLAARTGKEVGNGLRGEPLCFRLWALKDISRLCGTGGMIKLWVLVKTHCPWL